MKYCCYWLGCLCILLVGPWVSAQDMEVTYSPEYKESGQYWAPTVVDYHDGHYFVFQDGDRMGFGNEEKGDGYLAKLDGKLNQVCKTDLILKTDGKKEELVRMLKFGESLYLFSSLKKEGVYFFFNDYVKNMSLKPGKGPKMYVPTTSGKDKQAFAMIELTSSGTQQRKVVFSAEEPGMLAVVNSIYRTDDGKFLMVCKQGKKYRFAEVRLPE